MVVGALPRRPNGKLDHPAVAALHSARVQAPRDGLGGPASSHVTGRAAPPTVREIFARTFPGQVLDDEASFVDLGGDSLT